MNEAPRLRITEIFHSLQGESATVGCPTVFVRLTGCPLRCGYCDTEYAFTGGEWQTLDAIVETVAAYDTPYVTVTGGEPLAQKNCLPLLTQLCDRGYQVSLETSGALDVSDVDPRVKFVICDRADYEWAVDMLTKHDLAARCGVLFSPSFGQQDAAELAGWVLQDRLPVRMQLQLHKILWNNEPGR
jgi:7-carboxy-7-deazaguanine synthase